MQHVFRHKSQLIPNAKKKVSSHDRLVVVEIWIGIVFVFSLWSYSQAAVNPTGHHEW